MGISLQYVTQLTEKRIDGRLVRCGMLLRRILGAGGCVPRGPGIYRRAGVGRGCSGNCLREVIKHFILSQMQLLMKEITIKVSDRIFLILDDRIMQNLKLYFKISSLSGRRMKSGHVLKAVPLEEWW